MSELNLQEVAHDVGHDYEPGSPHLSHPRLRNEILGHVRTLVRECFEKHGRCRVLEIGAGHGAFTDHVLAMGAQVTVTEMSRPSLDVLAHRYEHAPGVRLVYDPDGEAAFGTGGDYDLILCVSVLHHIPDYESFVHRAVALVAPDGVFASFQDPTWYPRRSLVALRLDRLMFLAWRVRQGRVKQGVATQIRRFRGRLDPENPSDIVEYHVVRDGVDEEKLVSVLQPHFADVALWRYFSTQGRWMQALGRAAMRPQTFALVARGRRPRASPFAAAGDGGVVERVVSAPGGGFGHERW